MKAPCKELAPLIRAARAAGWRIERTGGNHLRWLAPSGAIVVSSSSPSDWRAVRAHKALLRRHGLAC